MSDNAIVQFVGALKHRPRYVSQQHDIDGKGGLQWLTLPYRLENVKLSSVGPWLVEIRDELTARGVTVRDITTKIHALVQGAESDPSCLVTAEFSVNSSQQLDELNDAFFRAAREIMKR